MKRLQQVVRALGVCLLVLGAAGCYPAPPPPGAYPPVPPSTFDRAWTAVIGAFGDEGVQIVHQDRAAGVIRGTRGGVNVSGEVRTQAGGSVRVEFGASGNIAADPTLNDRISQSYNRRMGR
jgi:hypothetical protein